MFEDYEIHAINDSIKEYESNYDPHGFIRFLSTTKRFKCSIIGQYFKPSPENVVTISSWKKISKAINNIHDIDIKLPKIDEGDYYHGLSPIFTAEVIKELIRKGGFRNIETLLNFLERYKRHYNWILPCQINEKEFIGIEEYYIYTVLKMSSHFGYIFKIEDPDIKSKIENIIILNPSIFIKDVTYKWENNDTIILLGGPTDDILFALSDIHFTKNLLIVKKDTLNSYSFNDFYLTQKKIESIEPVMLGDASYYSGVIAKLMQIDAPRSPEDGNNHIRVMRLLVARTTFSTLDAFDYGNILPHPILNYELESSSLTIRDTVRKIRKAEYNKMKNIFDYDNKKQKDKSHARTLLDLVNSYLKSSINTNTIAVSSNLTSRDDCLIGAVRNSGSIDTGLCYCSSNGQMEFRDKYVTFYRNSVYVDLPTLAVPKSDEYLFERLDFTKEIERETIAELNTSHFSATWRYYGISILGVVDKIGNGDGATRLHFNVLTENSLLDDFIDVCEFRNNATESFENNRLIGFKPIKISSIFSTFISWIIDHGDFITNILLIIIVLYERFNFGLSGDVIDTSVAIIFVLLEVIYISASVYHYLKKKHQTKAKIKFIPNMIIKRKDSKSSLIEEKIKILSGLLLISAESLRKKMLSMSNIYKSEPHSIFILMYLLNSISQTIEED